MKSADWLLPQLERDLIGVIGREATFRLAGAVFDPVRRFGLIYIPCAPQGKSFARVAAVIGEANAQKLVTVYGGTELRFGPCGAWVNRVRDASIRSHWRHGTLPVKWIAWLHDVTDRQVRNICQGEPRLERPAALKAENAARMRERHQRAA